VPKATQRISTACRSTVFSMVSASH
jgi:hypothetical protein